MPEIKTRSRPRLRGDEYIGERPRFNRGEKRLAGRRRFLAVAAILVTIWAGYTWRTSPRARPIVRRHLGYASEQGDMTRPHLPGAAAVPFSRVAGTDVLLMLPAPEKEVIAVGFHQAYNRKALTLASEKEVLPRPTSGTVQKTLADGGYAAFVMEARGRGTPLSSSVDVALNDNALVRAPVSGKVLEVVPYLLYGKINDVRIDIEPAGNPKLKVSIVHISDPRVTPGQRVKAGMTPIATVRSLGINSQIDQYLGRTVSHVHIQTNPVEARPVAAGVN